MIRDPQDPSSGKQAGSNEQRDGEITARPVFCMIGHGESHLKQLVNGYINAIFSFVTPR